MTKTAATGSKHIKSYFSEFFNNICHITEGILLILKNSLFFKIPLMASLNILYSGPHNFLKEGTKKLGNYIRKFFVAHQKFCKIFDGPSIFSWNISWPLQKPSGPPSYILNVRSLTWVRNFYKKACKSWWTLLTFQNL